MTMEQLQELWPFKLATVDKNGKGEYAPVTVTVAKVFNSERGLSLRFKEDTTQDGQYTGVIWNVAGKWNEMANKPDPYDGPIPTDGQQLTVTLKRSPRNNGGYFYDATINSEHYYTP